MGHDDMPTPADDKTPRRPGAGVIGGALHADTGGVSGRSSRPTSCVVRTERFAQFARGTCGLTAHAACVACARHTDPPAPRMRNQAECQRNWTARSISSMVTASPPRISHKVHATASTRPTCLGVNGPSSTSRSTAEATA